MVSYLIWIFAGVALIAMVLYLFLNKFYDLESWLKKTLLGLMGIGIIGTIGSFLMIGNLPSKDKKPVAVVEKAAVVTEKTVSRENDAMVQKARSVERELDKAVMESIAKTRALYQDSLDRRKKKRWDTFRYDSLLLTVETVEKLVESRKTFLNDDIIAYLEGNMDERPFDRSITKYKTDIDSLLNAYRIKMVK